MRTIVLAVAVLALTAAVGCQSVTKSAEENVRTAEQIDNLAFRQLTDDWNMIWFYDRQSRLSQWYTR